MGRKGVSKRKRKQTKAGSAPGAGTNAGRISEMQPLAVTAKNKAEPTLRGDIKNSSGSNKEQKKR